MLEHATDYRHIELSDGTHRIVGFALWYQDRASSNSFFDALQLLIEETKQLGPRIEFSRQSEDSFSLAITMPTGFAVDIGSIPGKCVQDLCHCLQEYGQFFLLTGFTDAAGDHLTPECVYVAQYFYLDGQLLIGSERSGYPRYLLERFREKLATPEQAGKRS